MCGVESSGSKSKHTDGMCAIEPLENDEAFEIIEGRELWHPVWKGSIDDKVNALFIKSIIQRIWRDENISALLSMCQQD